MAEACQVKGDVWAGHVVPTALDLHHPELQQTHTPEDSPARFLGTAHRKDAEE